MESMVFNGGIYIKKTKGPVELNPDRTKELYNNLNRIINSGYASKQTIETLNLIKTAIDNGALSFGSIEHSNDFYTLDTTQSGKYILRSYTTPSNINTHIYDTIEQVLKDFISIEEFLSESTFKGEIVLSTRVDLKITKLYEYNGIILVLIENTNIGETCYSVMFKDEYDKNKFRTVAFIGNEKHSKKNTYFNIYKEAIYIKGTEKQI